MDSGIFTRFVTTDMAVATNSRTTSERMKVTTVLSATRAAPRERGDVGERLRPPQGTAERVARPTELRSGIYELRTANLRTAHCVTIDPRGHWLREFLPRITQIFAEAPMRCLLYTSDAADDLLCVDLGGRRI